MKKSELIEKLAEDGRLLKPEAKRIVEVFFNQIANSLARGDRVEIRGFCSLSVKKYNAYTGRNPKTGEITPVKSKKLPVFRVGKELLDRLNDCGEKSTD